MFRKRALKQALEALPVFLNVFKKDMAIYLLIIYLPKSGNNSRFGYLAGLN